MRIGEKIVCLAQDSMTMSERCILLSLHNPDAFLTGIGTPILMMLLFVCVLGGAMKTGSANYVDYLVPGIILQCIGQCGCTTAVSVNNDLKGGMVDRFRSMPVAASSVLAGHMFCSHGTQYHNCGPGIWHGVSYRIQTVGGWYTVAHSGWNITFIYGGNDLDFNDTGSYRRRCRECKWYLSRYYVSAVSQFRVCPDRNNACCTACFAEKQPMTPIIETIRSLLMNAELDAHFLPRRSMVRRFTYHGSCRSCDDL